MRPLRLSVEGFTSFRDRVDVDFSGLDLFAIIGPTGAGKSSLIDAIVFALYGQVPRVGDDYKQLISHGVERLSVLFEFGVGERRYRVARVARRDRASQQRLERLRDGAVEPIADKAREIRAEVEKLVGLDYEGFTRAVVLPQGQFDAFLKGEPKERRQILVALLSLSVYERMLQLANQRAATARAEAEFLHRQLESDYGDATPEALAGARADLQQAERAAAAAEGALAGLGDAARLAQQVRAARRDLDALSRGETSEQGALASAEEKLQGAGAELARVECELAARRREVEAAACDEARLGTLKAAMSRAEQFLALRPALDRLTHELAARQVALDQARADSSAIENELRAFERVAADARTQAESARAARDSAHQQHVAAGLRRGLRPGDPCPVCAQPVGRLAVENGSTLEAAEGAAQAAEEAVRAALEALQQGKLRLVEARGAVEGLGREIAQIEQRCAEARERVAAVEDELMAAGVLPLELTDSAALVGRLGAERDALEEGHRLRGELGRAVTRLEERRAALLLELASSTARRDSARERLDSIVIGRRAGAAQLEEVRTALFAKVAAAGWAGIDTPPTGADELDVLEELRAGAQRGASQAVNLAAASRSKAERIGGAVARAGELREQRAALEAQAALHKTLADHLKANELVAWIQEEALQRLAQDGSRHLALLSQGRYALRLGAGQDGPAAKAEQDFFVVDHWNLDGVRSVRTLSGGETFLASLALALALAESLADLAAEGRAAQSLESLFLDEGFGSLDAETLEVVVSALDALHGGRRTVGIVTHIRELAERLPARLEVRQSGSVSSVALA